MENKEIVELYERVVPKHIRVFFSEKGVTSTEAQHKSELAGKLIESKQAELKHTKAFCEKTEINGREVTLANPRAINISEMVMASNNYTILRSWFLEAIKVKDKLLADIKSDLAYNMLTEEEQKSIPESTLRMPVVPYLNARPVTEEEILNDWSIADRFEYIRLQAIASDIGKMIHKDGVVDRLRISDLEPASTELRKVSIGNVDTILVEKSKVYEEGYVEKEYLKLQSEHRSANAKLNYLKGRIKAEMDAKFFIRKEEATEKLAIAREKFNLDLEAYTKEQNRIQSVKKDLEYLANSRRIKLNAYVANLKITIPNGMQPMLDQLNAEIQG